MDCERELRYIIDIDISSKKIASWKKDLRENLTKDHSDPKIARIFPTKGQYNKLLKKVYQSRIRSCNPKESIRPKPTMMQLNLEYHDGLEY